MSAVSRFEHRFVESAPRELSSGVLYVSLEYCTMLHLCACGCGRKVVTPLSPKDWSMTFNGKTVTVHPSIGSWSLPCQSHYLIKRGKVVWAGKWSDEQIQKGRDIDRIRKRPDLSCIVQETPETKSVELKDKCKRSPFSRLVDWLRRNS